MKMDINGLSTSEVQKIVERLRGLKLESYIARLDSRSVLQTYDASVPDARPMFADICSLF